MAFGDKRSARYTKRHYYRIASIPFIMPPQQSVSISQRRSLDTVSTWALFVTVIAALFVITPFASIPFTTTKTFVLAAGALITLALYILARLTRGNVIFPSSLLIGVLWLPVAAYVLSAAFSGVSFSNALWGTALEPDTLGFMLIAACLGTLGALVLRRPDHYRSFMRVGAYTFAAVAFLEALVIIVGQFSPQTVSPSSLYSSRSGSSSFRLARIAHSLRWVLCHSSSLLSQTPRSCGYWLRSYRSVFSWRP